MTENPLPENLSVDVSFSRRCGLTLTGLELAVFGSSPNPQTIEAFRYRCERVQRLILAQWPQPKRRRHHQRASVPGGLLTTAQAAAKLNCSVKTLNGYVKAGVLKYVATGHGAKRPRKMFTVADVDEFIANQTRKDSPCLSTASRARRTGISTSSGTVIDFTAPRKLLTDAKRKK